MIGISAKEAKKNLNDDQLDIIDRFKDIVDESITLIISNASIDNTFVSINFDKFTSDVLDECKEHGINTETVELGIIVNYLVIGMAKQLENLGFKCDWSYKNTFNSHTMLIISWGD